MAGEPWSGWGGSLRAVRAGVLKEGLAMLWWRGVGRRARQGCCARFQRWFGVQHRTSTDSLTSSLVVVGQRREAPSLRHHWREASRLMLTEHMFFKISNQKSTQMWTHSESFLRPIFFLSFFPPPLLKNFFFKGVTLPSSGSERNFFLRVLLFLLKKKMPVLIQPNYF